MERLREAWHNDLLLAMLSSKCAGLFVGSSLVALFATTYSRWFIAVLVLVAPLAWASYALLKRAEIVRAARWERREWR